MFLTSRCNRFQAAFLPEYFPQPIFKLNGSRTPLETPLWQITCDSGTPQEFITAVTTALADELARNPESPLYWQGKSSPYALRQRPGWTATVHASTDGTTHRVTSADQLANYTVHQRRSRPGPVAPECDPGWNFSSVVPGGDSWQATFSRHTPDFLVRAFHRAVTSDSSLDRHPESLPAELLLQLRDKNNHRFPRWIGTQARSSTQGLYAERPTPRSAVPLTCGRTAQAPSAPSTRGAFRIHR